MLSHERRFALSGTTLPRFADSSAIYMSGTLVLATHKDTVHDARLGAAMKTHAGLT